MLLMNCACGCGGATVWEMARSGKSFLRFCGFILGKSGGVIVWEMARSGKSFVRFCGFMLGKSGKPLSFLPHFLRRVRI